MKTTTAFQRRNVLRRLDGLTQICGLSSIGTRVSSRIEGTTDTGIPCWFVCKAIRPTYEEGEEVLKDGTAPAGEKVEPNNA
jgi:hypothetical protein